MKKVLSFIWNCMRRYKYGIVIIVGTLVVGVLDENSFRTRIMQGLRISDLKEEIDTYNKQNEEDTKKLHELRRDPRTIEKIARERYFMKADDEDIYVLSDDELQFLKGNETAR